LRKNKELDQINDSIEAHSALSYIKIDNFYPIALELQLAMVG